MTAEEFLEQIAVYQRKRDVQAIVDLSDEWAFKLESQISPRHWVWLGETVRWAQICAQGRALRAPQPDITSAALSEEPDQR